jgi:hypothetical protein
MMMVQNQKKLAAINEKMLIKIMKKNELNNKYFKKKINQ